MKAIVKRKFTAKEQKAIEDECLKEFLKLIDVYNRDSAIQVMHILHFDYGFGMNRLQQFIEKLNVMQSGMLERFELTADDTPWICEQQLRDDGIDLDKLLLKEAK